MLKQAIIFLFILSTVQTLKCQTFNFDIEKFDSKGKPYQWVLGFSQDMMESYPAVVDSTIKHSGKYSLKLYNERKAANFGSCSIVIPSTFTGKQIILKGFLKTENVKNGYAGFWMRLDGVNGNVGFDNMNKRGITGTNDWKEFSISLPFTDDVQKINVGALLVGEGTMWIDDLSLQIDGKDLSKVDHKAGKIFFASLDTTFRNGSGIAIQLNAQRLEALTVLGEIWGFLKYHHSSIAEGNYNWDAELMRILPEVLSAKDKNEWLSGLEKWVDKLPSMPVCSDCKPIKNSVSVKLQPDHGKLFQQGYLSSSLLSKLKYVQSNSNNSSNYYIALVKGVGNPEITHEDGYFNMTYPDAGFRLLSLYRYWNLVKYFFPYCNLIGEDWNSILPEFIPTFINAKDSLEYVLACQKLIANVHDTHANVWGMNKALEAYRGKYYPPFSAIFIEDKLVVRNFYTDTAGIKQLVAKGDIITAIDGKSIEACIKEVLPLTPASNYSTQLRDIPYHILRGQTDKVSITVIRNNKEETIHIPRYEAKLLNSKVDYDPNPLDSSYKVIKGDIGYVFPGKYKNEQLPAIMNAFKNTKGIIVDFRCYPSSFMPFTFGEYIKQKKSPFVVFTVGSLEHPGLFTFQKELSNGGKYKDYYKGKVIVIVNEQTQSSAEYTTMAFQSAPNVTVIGSTTAGADGNVTRFSLPGGVYTMFSGIGVYYPDKTETQRTGVKIDIVIKPTLQAYKEGKDELLEKAIELIRNQ